MRLEESTSVPRLAEMMVESTSVRVSNSRSPHARRFPVRSGRCYWLWWRAL